MIEDKDVKVLYWWRRGDGRIEEIPVAYDEENSQYMSEPRFRTTSENNYWGIGATLCEEQTLNRDRALVVKCSRNQIIRGMNNSLDQIINYRKQLESLERT